MLKERIDLIEADISSGKVVELTNEVQQLTSEKENINKQLGLLKGERQLVASQLKSMDEQVNEMRTSIVRQHRRIDQLETDNKRLANHNHSLLSQLVKGQNPGRKRHGKGPKSVQVYEPAEIRLQIASIQIAEPDTVIISGGTRNGQTVKTVTAIRQDFTSVELEELPIPLKQHCSTVYAGQVFVIGGKTDGGFPRNNVYMLMTGRSWRVASSMIYARYVNYIEYSV